MNVLFLTMDRFENPDKHGIYSDLLNQIKKHDNEVYIVSPNQRRLRMNTKYEIIKGFHFLRVKVGNITQCGIIEKGVSMVMLESQFKRAIQEYLSNVKFDLVIYSTPPITFTGAVEYVKKRDDARTYLLLKDIFPQNAVDIGLMSTAGLKGLLYKHFRKQEKKMYAISDHIGCMSQANVDYVIKHNPEVNPDKVEVCPNTTDPIDMSCTESERIEIRTKYGIPLDKTVFVYGGNLGKPQDIPFIINCLRTCQDIKEAFFLIVGNGTEYGKLEKFVNVEKPNNVKLMQRLPKEDYDKMIGSCDVGLIFLDHRFTIPNFPSRLLSYMAAKLPVIACTDVNSDIGKTVVDGGFGWWCESNNTKAFVELVKIISEKDWTDMKAIEYEYLKKHYSSKDSYDIIMRHLNN